MTQLMNYRPEEAINPDNLDVLARTLNVKNAELQPTLDAIVAEAARTVPNASWAGLLLAQHQELTPQSHPWTPPV